MRIFVYILKCQDGSYYVGTAREDLEKRVYEHNHRFYNGWTSKRLPVTLVFSQEFEDPIEAIAAEKQIKGWRREKKEALIKGNYEILPKLSKTSRN